MRNSGERSLSVVTDESKRSFFMAGSTTTTQRGSKEAARKGSDLAPLRDEYLFFGPLGESTYLSYGPSYPNDLTYAVEMIRAAFSDLSDGTHDKAREARGAYWKTFELLQVHLANHPENCAIDLVTDLYSFVSKHNARAESQLGEIPSELGLHLKNVTQFSSELLLNKNYTSLIPSLLSTRHAQLLASVVAPLHDILKYLGDESSQVIPEHEIVLAETGKKYFAGRTVKINGVSSVLNDEDVSFITSVIGDHENIYKEIGRLSFISSEDPIQRAKAIFSFIDTLAGAFERSANKPNSWQLNESGFTKRFVHLCSRHVEGKIFRPRWIVSATQELLLTIDQLTNVLDDKGDKVYSFAGMHPHSSINEDIIDGAILGINNALAINDQRLAKNSEILPGSKTLREKTLSGQELEAVIEQRNELIKLKRSLA